MRPLIYINSRRSDRFECDNLVLACLDFRFHKQMSELLAYAGYGDFDLLSLPGASLAVTNEESRDTVFRSIALVIKVHGVKRVIIVDHQDCAAFGRSSEFTSPKEEEQCHSLSMKEAAGILQQRFEALEIIQMYMDWGELRAVQG